MTSKIRLFVICAGAVLLSQLLMLHLMSGGNVVQAQVPLRVAEQWPQTGPAQASNDANGRDLRPATKFSPSAPAEPDSPQSPNAGYSYDSILGTAFTPVDSGAAYIYDGNGCIHQTVDPVVNFQAPLNLPPGSVIKYVRFYYYDASIYDMNLWLRRYQPGASNSTLAIATSSGTAGLSSASSDEITETLDTFNYTYALTWGAVSTTSSGQQICGVRVAYYAPQIFGTFLPAIQRNP